MPAPTPSPHTACSPTDDSSAESGISPHSDSSAPPLASNRSSTRGEKPRSYHCAIESQLSHLKSLVSGLVSGEWGGEATQSFSTSRSASRDWSPTLNPA